MVGLGAREASVQIHHPLFLVANSLSLLSFLSSRKKPTESRYALYVAAGRRKQTIWSPARHTHPHTTPGPTSSLRQYLILGRALQLRGVVPPGSPLALSKYLGRGGEPPPALALYLGTHPNPSLRTYHHLS